MFIMVKENVFVLFIDENANLQCSGAPPKLKQNFNGGKNLICTHTQSDRAQSIKLLYFRRNPENVYD